MTLPDGKSGNYEKFIREFSLTHDTTFVYTIRKDLKGRIKYIFDRYFEYTFPDYRLNIKFIVNNCIHGQGIINRMISRAAQGKDILEIGCSGGGLCLEIARKNPDANILGVDITENFLKAGRDYYDLVSKKEKLGKITYRYHDVNVTPLPEESFDVIVSMATLPCLVDKKKAVGELKKALKKGGLLIIYEGRYSSSFLEKNVRRLTPLLFPFLFVITLFKDRKPLSYQKATLFVKKLYGWEGARPCFKNLKEFGVEEEDIFSLVTSELVLEEEIRTRCFIDCFTKYIKKNILTFLIIFPLKALDDLILACGFLEGTTRYSVFRKE